MTIAVEDVADPSPSATARVTVRRVAIALAIVLAIAASAWWFLGGTHVGAPQGDLVGMVVAPGELASVGVPLVADGTDARLEAVRATVTPGAALAWSAYQQQGELGFGSWLGPLEPTWSVDPIEGARVSDGVPGTWIIGTLSSDAPGLYRVSDITVDYRSGWRSRSEDSKFVYCVLVLPDGVTAEEFEARDEPLWQDFQSCLTDHG